MLGQGCVVEIYRLVCVDVRLLCLNLALTEDSVVLTFTASSLNIASMHQQPTLPYVAHCTAPYRTTCTLCTNMRTRPHTHAQTHAHASSLMATL